MDVYERRIEPLFSGSRPSSRNQCHLSGIDLSMYAKGTPCATMACLRKHEMIDFEAPEESASLSQIAQAEPQSALITEAVIQAEHDGFLEWIQFSAACDDTVGPDLADPCEARTDAPTPPGVLTPLGQCSEESLAASFEQRVFDWRFRCDGCHSNCKPDYPAPCWLVEDFEPEALDVASLQTMYNLLGIGAVDVDAPESSNMILVPAGPALGGITHGGGDKFADGADAAYQDFLLWVQHYAACYHGQTPPRPLVEILEPSDKARVFQGDGLTFWGAATDEQQPELAPDAFVWTSSKTEQPIALGPGPHVLDTLDVGKHIITLARTDDDGNVGTRAIKIWIKAPP